MSHSPLPLHYYQPLFDSITAAKIQIIHQT